MQHLSASYSGTRVLVTGATGFIASHVMRALDQAGAEVVGVARRRATFALDGCSSFHQADLADLDACRALIKAARPDHIFHLASHVTGRQDLGTVIETFRANLSSTVNLLTAIAELSKPRSIVIAGSSEEPRVFSLADEQTAPTSPYAAAKLSSAAYAAFFRLTYALPISHARIFMIYGPGQRDLAKLVPYVTTELLRGRTPALASGRRRADWTFAEDAASGILALGLRPEVVSAEIGTGRLASVGEVAALLRDAIQPDATISIGTTADRLNETERVANVEETERLIGWRPMVTLGVGLARTVEWYRSALSDLQPQAD